ncbi:MAG TPA: cytidine deaminase [Chitinophagales bacterium]|nr:cytidine deaminase [Chitinophagales bacterium]
MKEITQNFSYKELDSTDELPTELAELLVQAKIAIATAYAPYSNFKVGAAALLENGVIVSGSNQENASSPAGICAERVTLSAASALHPNVAVVALAISAKANDQVLIEPVAPCGICRQTILEYEQRFDHDIEIILQAEAGKVFRISSVKELLPLNFSMDNLK